MDGIYGPIARSGKQTMRLFLSVNGWSENVLPDDKAESEQEHAPAGAFLSDRTAKARFPNGIRGAW